MEDNFEMGLFDDLNFEPGQFKPDDYLDTPDDGVDDGIEGNDKDLNNINHGGEGLDEDPESVADSEDDQDEGGDNDEDGSDTPPNPNLFSSVATILSNQGVLPSLDIDNTEIKSVDDLTNAVKNEVDALYKARLVEQFGEEGYNYIEKGVAPEQVVDYQDRSNVLNSITEDRLIEDVDLSKNVIYEDYLSKGMSPEQAGRLIERIAQAGDEALIEDAKLSLNSLKHFTKAQIDKQAADVVRRQADAEKARVENELKVKNSIYGTTSLANGPDINKSVQDNVYKLMTTVVGKDQYGNPENALMKARRENQVEFDTKLYYLYELTKGFSDFSKFGRKGKSKAISDLERALQANQNDHSGQPGFVQDKNSYDSPYGDILNI